MMRPFHAAMAAGVLLSASHAVRSETSPLSFHAQGFGIAQSLQGGRERGMGEAGMASITKQGLSIANPSRTAWHDKTSFSVLADGDVDYLRDDVTSNRSATFLIPAIGLNFSLRKFGHLAFYYRQAYHRNFSFTPLAPISPDAVQSFAAEGGLYEASVTYALAPISSLALGLGYHYHMGRERLIEPTRFTGNPGNEDTFNGQDLEDTLSTRSQGGYPSLSATFRRPSFSVALRGALGSTLEMDSRRSISNLVTNQEWDGEKDLPWSLAAGLALKASASQSIVADFSWEAWESDTSGLLNPAFRAGLGYEYQGRAGIYEPYLRKLAYRGGLGFERLYLEETDLYFLTLGAGMPLGRRGSLLDFAIKYGHRGSLKNNLWAEDFVKLSVSLTGVGNWGQPVRKRK